MPMQGSRSSHCVHIPFPAGTALTIPYKKRWLLPHQAPTEKKRFVGALTTGVPCILETCVGLLAALGEPAASACFRVAKSTRTSARDITLALPTKLCCVTRRRAPFHVDKSLVTCNRCRCNINGHTIYMYTGMGFCSRDCRYHYYVDEVEAYRKRLAAALMERSKRSWIVTRVLAGSKANKLATEAGEGSHRPTFFTCAEAEGFP